MVWKRYVSWQRETGGFGMFDDIVGTVKKGWTIGPLTAVQHKGKTLRLYQCTKTCRDCGATMRHNMNRAALEGRVKNRGIDYTRCADCRNGRRKPAAEEPAAPAAATPQDGIVYLIQRNEALTIENAELKAAAKFAAPVPSVADQALSRSEKEELESLRKRVALPNPVATPAQIPALGADTAELESLRKFKLDVFSMSRYVEYGPAYTTATGAKKRDLLGPAQVTDASLLAHVKEVGKLYTGVWRVFGGFEDAQVALNRTAYNQSYMEAAHVALDDTSVRKRIESEAQDEADAKYPRE